MSTFQKYLLLVFLFLGTGLNIIQAQTDVSTGVDFGADLEILEMNEHEAFFSLAPTTSTDLMIEDLEEEEEEEEQEEEVLEFSKDNGKGNYYSCLCSVDLKKVQGVARRQIIRIPLLEPIRRLAQKRYLFLEVFRL